jgi:phosphoenolpyruvate synthase/pyruvate phosphate dikinase
VPALLRRKETLNYIQVGTLIDWAKKSEAYFSQPQDLEWAFCGADFYILQSRPITTLSKPKDEMPNGEYVLFKPLAEIFTAFIPHSTAVPFQAALDSIHK